MVLNKLALLAEHLPQLSNLDVVIQDGLFENVERPDKRRYEEPQLFIHVFVGWDIGLGFLHVGFGDTDDDWLVPERGVRTSFRELGELGGSVGIQVEQRVSATIPED